MTAIFVQVFTLFVFVAVGYILGKKRLVPPENAGILSTLLVYVVLPCNVFQTFSSNFSPSYLSANREMLLVSLLLLAVTIVIGHGVARMLSKEAYESYVYEYSFIIPNFGYMGYALTEALLGEAGLMNIMVFGLPSTVYLYTVGFAKLTKQGLNPKKLINPTVIATVLGIAAGLCGLRIPDAVGGILSKASVCMGPLSMLLTGIVVAELPFKEVISNAKVYILVAVRMFMYPLLMFFVLPFFCSGHILETALLFYSLPFGLNTVVFPKLVGEDCRAGTGLALISTVVACISLPLLLGFFGIGT